MVFEGSPADSTFGLSVKIDWIVSNSLLPRPLVASKDQNLVLSLSAAHSVGAYATTNVTLLGLPQARGRLLNQLAVVGAYGSVPEEFTIPE